ncbi:uncharacterized protein LOC101782808 [Setaria italica]|uniref:Uncharacterized protein n=1 Tax=Setaria italica TaxID=4555 RepID=K4AGT1_SETIT|nr:uncharacterized protein LOC101782808 [Setaria italica]
MAHGLPFTPKSSINPSLNGGPLVPCPPVARLLADGAPPRAPTHTGGAPPPAPTHASAPLLRRHPHRRGPQSPSCATPRGRISVSLQNAIKQQQQQQYLREGGQTGGARWIDPRAKFN